MTIRTITPRELKDLLTGEPRPRLIDVRTPAEFREVHVAGARNMPLDRLSASDLRPASGREAETTYFICKSGNRGRQACENMQKAGRSNVANVGGGTEACVAAELPVERGRKAISLERQVRIVAGSLVFIGALLAMTVNIYFAAIPAFVGGGLLFAGISDTCGMALLLARMPWNN